MRKMKNIKRFEIDVQTAFDGEDYDGEGYPLKIIDLETDFASARADAAAVVELVVFGDNESVAAFQLNLDGIDALFDVLNHIRDKVQASRKPLDAEEAVENEEKL